jgi:hypothetical protein
MKRISCSRETTLALVKEFRVSARIVCDALMYKTGSDLSRRIRRRALEMGCREEETELIKVIKYI